ncbi:MAG TPA: DUF4105 domain-containing protein [Polyangiaceae bacterium]|nr:DUF4105 domain-containing protein [Polyangiaceae bacterium]
MPLAVLPGGGPRISVLTFGPGDQTFSKFGHDALWVHDPSRPPKQRDLVYNYGTFRFDSPWLILDFLKGRLQYWLSVSTLDRTLASYRAANRSVSAQELALSGAQFAAITAFLAENAKPENASYRYDYYRDNCATRIRDVIDQHLGGALKAASGSPAPLTYRDHTRRLTIGSPPLFFALDLALGPLIDRPISEWDEMFLPARVEAKLAQLKTEQGQPLVKRRITLFEAKRDPPLEEAPTFRWGWLIIGVAVGAALYVASRFEQRWARASLGLALGVSSFFVGLLGWLLLVLWLLTDHEVTYWNLNVLLCPFWAVAIPFLAPGFSRATPRHAGLMMRLVGAAAATSLLALVLRGVLPASQQMGPSLSLFVPLWLGACAAVWTRVGRPWPRWLPAARSASVAVPPT